MEIYDKLAGNWSLLKTVAFVATIFTEAIDENRAVSICDAALGGCLYGSIGSSVSSFYSSSLVLSW